MARLSSRARALLVPIALVSPLARVAVASAPKTPSSLAPDRANGGAPAVAGDPATPARTAAATRPSPVVEGDGPLGGQPIPVRVVETRAIVGPPAGPAAAGARDFTQVGFDDATWVRLARPTDVAAPLPSPEPNVPPIAARPGVTRVPAAAGGVLRLRSHFDVERPRGVRVLELAITYHDAVIVWLNGREVARRNLALNHAGERAAGAHGGEPEHIRVAIRAAAGRRPGDLQPTGNVLAVEVLAAPGRLPVDANAPLASVGLQAFDGPRLVRGPYAIAPVDGGVSLAFESDLPSRGRALVSPLGKRGVRPRVFASGRPATRHVVRIARLPSGASYQYQVELDGPARGDHVRSGVFPLPLPPSNTGALRFAVYGDMRAPGHIAHAEVVAALVKEAPTLVLNTGDLVAVGAEESAWQKYFELTAPLGAIAAVVPALGNHDAAGVGGASKSWELFGMKSHGAQPGYTSFDWGGAHFVILDSNHVDAEQLAWLREDLARARRHRARAVFAFVHAGPWSHGPHGGSETMAREVAPILVRGGVRVLFSGHDHLYERGLGETPVGPLPYVVTGGGGAPLYGLTCELPSNAAAASRPVSGAAGARPVPPCPRSVLALRKAHHYVIVEVDGEDVRLCPRQPDGTAIEPCVSFPARP